jgi:hypothetical protein
MISGKAYPIHPLDTNSDDARNNPDGTFVARTLQRYLKSLLLVPAQLFHRVCRGSRHDLGDIIP